MHTTCMKWQNWTQMAMSLFTVRSKVGLVSMQSFRQLSRKSEWHVSTSSTLFTWKQYISLYLVFHSIRNYSAADPQCLQLTRINETTGIHFQCKISVWFQNFMNLGNPNHKNIKQLQEVQKAWRSTFNKVQTLSWSTEYIK